MSSNFVLAVFVLYAVIVNVLSEQNDKSNMPGQLRVKRAKYYSNSPTRFFRKPPITYPVKGYFSYTPPPNYMMDNDGPPYPGNFRPKVSKRPTITSDGLGDDDINSLVKHLSKQDLDKLIEFAGEKQKDSPIEKYNTQYKKLQNRELDNVYKPPVRDLSAVQKFPFVSYVQEQQVETTMSSNQLEIIKSRNVFTKNEDLDQYPFKGPYAPGFNSVKENFASNPPQMLADFSSLGLDIQESMQNSPFSDVQQENSNTPANNAQYTFTDSKIMGEEQLPKPVNLREAEDYEVSHSSNVPTVVKANSYDVKSFGDLPLMNYNSKLDTVSSYHVPHYTVISPSQQLSAASYSSSSSSQLLPSSAAASIRAPQLELAPPSSAAKEQSDAHLKAIKIWTHKSSGAAYTLHDDGTLSAEKPLRPKSSYGISY